LNKLPPYNSPRPGLKEAVDETYLPLLSLTTSEPVDTSPSSLTTQSSTPPFTPADILPDPTKLAMILEASQDIIYAEKALREVETLKARDVEGSGELERAFSPALHVMLIWGRAITITKQSQSGGPSRREERKRTG
jgi:hypothetical protein